MCQGIVCFLSSQVVLFCVLQTQPKVRYSLFCFIDHVDVARALREIMKHPCARDNWSLGLRCILSVFCSRDWNDVLCIVYSFEGEGEDI